MKSLAVLLFLAASVQAADLSPDILKVRENAPEVRRARAAFESLSALESAARQIPNPEIDAEFTSRTSGDRPNFDGQAAYLHTFEMGGKRGARRQTARAQLALAAARLDQAREEATLQAILGIHRLRQLETEFDSVSEAMETFRGITGRYSSRARLSPEQQTALSLFKMAEVDYDLRRAGIARERRELHDWFVLAIGTVPLPAPRPTEWPALDNNAASSGGARGRAAEAEVSLARAELAHAVGESWPDMKLGPMVTMESGRGQDTGGVGAAASFPLPLYQHNAAGRAVGKAGLAQAENLRAFSEKEWQSALSSNRAAYAEAVQALRRAPDAKEMSRMHEATEGLFERGLLEPALVIEAHRQMTDVVANTNAAELEALRALWTVRALTGQALEAQP